MTIVFNLHSGGCRPQEHCDPCDEQCPDFIIKRHDTKPAFKVSIEDCNGPMELRGLVIEANMWALGKLKADLDAVTDYFQLADHEAFNQIMVGDIIVFDRVRMPEYVLVTGFDEINKFVQVQRGYHGTTAGPWKKGTKVRIFRVMNAPAEAEMVFDDERQVDGEKKKDILQQSFLVYEWQPEDTCLPGCYWFEFKIIKMIDTAWFLPGGRWTGPVHHFTDGFVYSGTLHTDSSVKLSLDQLTNFYLVPQTNWTGPVHLWSDGNTFSGTGHDDGSVLLNKTGVPFSEDIGFDSEHGITSIVWHLQTGFWQGERCIGPNGDVFTGSSYTDSSVLLTVDIITGLYLIGEADWTGPHHRWAENVWYTGSIHNDGSVVLMKTEIPWNGGFSSDSGFHLMSNISIIPSFSEGLTPKDYGCILGEGVEYVRRIPVDRHEGFLVKIAGSPTQEL